jgi:ribose/xylose/arabinose/galactoside ABC-type transport system permease subunit
MSRIPIPAGSQVPTDKSIQDRARFFKNGNGQRARAMLRENFPLIGMILVLLGGGALEPNFFVFANLVSVAQQSTMLIIIAIGLSLPMLMRGVDLSVAQVTDASALIAAALVAHNQPIILAFVLPVVFSLFIGVINGWLMGYVGVPAIIGTLGMMFIVRSGELIYSHGSQPQILFALPRSLTGPFLFLGQGSLGPIPMILIFTLVIVVCMRLVTKSTIFGRQMDAVGGNVKAAFLSAVNVKKIFAGGFVLSSLMAALAGVTLASWTGIAVPRGAESYLLDAFVAVYLGTVTTRNGQIGVLGTLIGALFVGALNNQLTLLGLGAAQHNILNGAFVLLAMAIGALRKKHR